LIIQSTHFQLKSKIEKKLLNDLLIGSELMDSISKGGAVERKLKEVEKQKQKHKQTHKQTQKQKHKQTHKQTQKQKQKHKVKQSYFGLH